MFIFFVMLVAAALLLVALSAMRVSLMSHHAYVKRSGLLSVTERAFLGVLEQAVGANFRIQVKVRAADVLAVDGSLSGGHRLAALNRMSSRYFDFVLVEPRTYAVVAAIELVTEGSGQMARGSRDGFLDSVCVMAKLPLIRIPARGAYEVQTLRLEVLHTLFPPVIASDVVDSVVALMAAK